jgi:hypothetical protein
VEEVLVVEGVALDQVQVVEGVQLLYKHLMLLI